MNLNKQFVLIDTREDSDEHFEDNYAIINTHYNDEYLYSISDGILWGEYEIFTTYSQSIKFTRLGRVVAQSNNEERLEKKRELLDTFITF